MASHRIGHLCGTSWYPTLRRHSPRRGRHGPSSCRKSAIEEASKALGVSSLRQGAKALSARDLPISQRTCGLLPVRVGLGLRSARGTSALSGIRQGDGPPSCPGLSRTILRQPGRASTKPICLDRPGFGTSRVSPTSNRAVYRAHTWRTSPRAVARRTSIPRWGSWRGRGVGSDTRTVGDFRECILCVGPPGRMPTEIPLGAVCMRREQSFRTSLRRRRGGRWRLIKRRDALRVM